MNADDKIVVFTAADVDALRNALAETSHVDSYLHEPVRALLARLDAISAASDAVVDAGPADMFSAEASEGHVIRCVIDGQDVGCKSVVVRGVYPVPEPVMVPWADARPGMVLVDRDADGEITGVALVGDDKVWRWVWTPYGIGRWGACGMSDGVLPSADADAEQGEIVACCRTSSVYLTTSRSRSRRQRPSHGWQNAASSHRRA